MRQGDGETDVWMTCAFVWRGIEALFDANSGLYIRQKTAGETIATVSSDRLGSGQARTSYYILDSHRSIAPQHVDILDHVCSALKCCVLSILARSIRHSHGSYWTVATILASLSMPSNRVAIQVLFVFRATVLYWWPAKIYSLSGRRLT